MQNPPGSYPPQQGYQPGGFQQPGGYPPAGPVSGKTQVLGLDYNVAAGLGYIPICALNLIVPILWLVTEPKTSKFVRFHAMQSLFLVAFTIVGIIGVVIVASILGIILTQVSEALGAIVGVIGFVAYIGVFLTYLILTIVGAVKGFGGQQWKMPIVGNFAEKYS